MMKHQRTHGRTCWHALAAMWLLALALLPGASPAQAQVYLRDEAPTRRGVYFLGYTDIYDNLHPTRDSVPPGVGITGEVYLSIGSSAGDYVLVNEYGSGWWTDDFTQDWECYFFGCWDYWDFIRDTQHAS